MTNLLKYFGLMGFLIWFVQTQHIFDKIKIPLFQEIRQCQICLGTWIGMVLYPSMDIKTIKSPLDIFITSSLISFLLYVFKFGWKGLFGTTIIR